jgi:prolyl oligopeptidase
VAGGQDKLYAAAAARWPGRERLSGALASLLSAGLVTAPVWRGERQFYLRREAGQEHAVLYTAAPGEEQRALIDPTAIDPAGTTTLDAWQPDHEGRLLAYQLSQGGEEESAVRVLDIATGEVVDGPVDRCRYTGLAWLPGGQAFYYARRLAPGQVPPGEEQYHRRVYLHYVGTPADDDVLIFGGGPEASAGEDKTAYYGVTVSRDGRWLVIESSLGTAPRNDAWIADLTESAPAGPARR